MIWDPYWILLVCVEVTARAVRCVFARCRRCVFMGLSGNMAVMDLRCLH